MARLSQSVTSGRGASVLPYDGIGDREPRGALPEKRGLALLRDPDGDVRAGQARFGERRARDVPLGTPDLEGVVLDPAGMWEDLAEFLLVGGEDASVSPENDGPRAGRSLVQREDGLHELCPRHPVFWFRRR